MKELFKRIKSGLWVSFGSFLVTTITLILENIGVLNLSPTEQMIAFAVGTGIITQITKTLNSK